MARTFDQMPVRDALAAIARDFHGRGWMAGTAGNLSGRDNHDEGCFWITSSGLPKGQLNSHDLIQIRIEDSGVQQRLRPEARPSAEAIIHQAVYSLFPKARACFHVHSVDACIAAERNSQNTTWLRLPPLEMIKGLGIWEETPRVDLPLFDNHFDVAAIAAAIRQRFGEVPPQTPALMIRNHGVTVWGESLQQTYDRVETVEFIMSYMARR